MQYLVKFTICAHEISILTNSRADVTVWADESPVHVTEEGRKGMNHPFTLQQMHAGDPCASQNSLHVVVHVD